jgi:hypothetical protein
MARIGTRSATAQQPATAAQRSSKRLLQTPPCNSAATVDPATSATALQHRCNKAQQRCNSARIGPRNSATFPYRGGETVAPSRAHPQTPGRTPSRLRLRAFRPDQRAGGQNAPHAQDMYRRPAAPIGYWDHAGMEGRKRPRQARMRVESGEQPDINAARAPRLAGLGQHQLLTAEVYRSPRWQGCRRRSNATAATAGAHTAPTCQCSYRAKPCFAGICAVWPHDRKSRGGGFRARCYVTFNTLSARRARARGRGRQEGDRSPKPAIFEAGGKKRVPSQARTLHARSSPILSRA